MATKNKDGSYTLTADEYKKQQQIAAANDPAIQAILSGKYSSASDGTTISKGQTKLNYNSAKALLEQTMMDAQVAFKLSKTDITDFMNKFNEEQSKQLEEVIKTVKTNSVPGASAQAIQEQIVSTMQTQYPSFFKPADFAKNYVWSKANFGDTATLGGKGLPALTDVRSILRGFGKNDMSELEIQNTARQIATGKLTKDSFAATLAASSANDYPLIADRVKTTPGATVRDILNPYIKTIAQELELDPESIALDDPLLDSLVRPDGVGGKVPMASLAAAKVAARKDKRWETTTAANTLARDGAVGLARAMGFGV